MITPASRDCDGATTKPQTVLIRFRSQPKPDDDGGDDGVPAATDGNGSAPKKKRGHRHTGSTISDEYRIPIDELLATGDDALWDRHPLAPSKAPKPSSASKSAPVRVVTPIGNGEEGSGDEQHDDGDEPEVEEEVAAPAKPKTNKKASSASRPRQ